MGPRARQTGRRPGQAARGRGARAAGEAVSRGPYGSGVALVADSPELFSRALMARSLAYVFPGGGVVGCLTLALPHDSSVQDGPLYALAALAVAIGLVVLWKADSIPGWAMH